MNKSELTELMSVFAFTEKDLDSNRKGYLSSQQKTTLRKNISQGIITLILIIILRAIIFWIVCIAIIVCLRATEHRNPTFLWTGGIGTLTLFIVFSTLAFLAIVVSVNLWGARQIRTDLNNNKIGFTSGKILILSSVNNEFISRVFKFRLASPTLRINSLEFPISRQQSNVLAPNTYYTIYFLPRSNILLSLEQIPDSNS
jgi:hypothetical protein